MIFKNFPLLKHAALRLLLAHTDIIPLKLK